MMEKSPFRSFWMAGYECSDKLNAFGNRVDLLQETGHLELIDEDYRLLEHFNIKTVREGIRWSKVERSPYQYDWSSVIKMIEAGKRNGIQQVWDLCHFGFPDDLTPLHPMFARRFAALCRSFINLYRTVEPDETVIVTPINEVGFISWLGGHARGTSPYCINQGWEVKYAMMKAYIEGVKAIREMDDNVLIMTTEPLCTTVPPLDADEATIEIARIVNDYQFQAMDILTGKICPELGGSPDLIDIMGANFYFNNQTILNTGTCLPWLNENDDPRWQPLSQLLKNLYQRYGCPIVLAETSHPGEHRPNWIEFVGRQCETVLREDVPFFGICLYPIIDRPDWDQLHIWHRSGLWDAGFRENKPFERILNLPYAAAVLDAQHRLKQAMQAKLTSVTAEPHSPVLSRLPSVG